MKHSNHTNHKNGRNGNSNGHGNGKHDKDTYICFKREGDFLTEINGSKTKRKPNAYALCVGKHMKGGKMTMAEAAAECTSGE